MLNFPSFCTKLYIPSFFMNFDHPCMSVNQVFMYCLIFCDLFGICHLSKTMISLPPDNPLALSLKVVNHLPQYFLSRVLLWVCLIRSLMLWSLMSLSFLGSLMVSCGRTNSNSTILDCSWMDYSEDPLHVGGSMLIELAAS